MQRAVSQRTSALSNKELALGQGKEQYISTKGLDPLGVLSHCGQIRRSGAVVLTDFELRTARGGATAAMGPEAMKSLVDIVEGGTIIGTRYRPTVFRPFLPRIMALQGDERSWGKWFHDQEVHGLAMVFDSLQNLAVAETALREMDAHSEAISRRMAVVVVPPDLSLIAGEAFSSLQVDTTTMATEARARRAATTL